MVERILHLIEQAGALMLMHRTHKKSLGTSFDTIASHSHHAAVIAYCIARMENLNHEEALRSVAMLVFHDLVEARTEDLGFVAKHYVVSNEKKAVKDQFKGISFGKDLENLINEFEERQTLAAKCAKDADSLEQLYQEWVLMWQGNKLAQRWFESDFKDRVPNLKTESAKKLANEMKKGTPQDWWWNELMKNETAVDLEKLLGKV